MKHFKSAVILLLFPCLSVAAHYQDFCGTVTNTHWVGGGHATGALTCDYRGEGNVSKVGNGYRLVFRAQKSGGGSLCPQQIMNYVVNFRCVNNQLSANENGTVMTGQLTSPQQMWINGKINIFDMVENINITAHRG